jgi:hypothetical protein
MGMEVNPKQSQTGVMWVARDRWVTFFGSKVERVMLAEMAQAS